MLLNSTTEALPTRSNSDVRRSISPDWVNSRDQSTGWQQDPEVTAQPLRTDLSQCTIKYRPMYRARDEVENEAWLEDLEAAAEGLDLDAAARSRAGDLFLSNLPDDDRSKRAVLAASLYVAGLVEGDRRSQGQVAEEVGVARLTIQQRWKPILEAAGLDAPEW